MASTGAVAAGADNPYGRDVFVFKSGPAPAVVKDYTSVGGMQVELQERGLAFSADGRRLFVVVAGFSGERPHLDVVAVP